MEAKRLPEGRYLAKLYLDKSDKLSKDFRVELGNEDLVGQLLVESSWPPGYGKMTVAKFPTDSAP